MVLGLELRRFCQGFVPAGHSPDSQRHPGAWQGGRRAALGTEVHHSPLASSAALAVSSAPGAAPQTV